jgi:colicin import membrane protein
MKTNYIKCSILLLAALCFTITSRAQTVVHDSGSSGAKQTHENYDVNHTDDQGHHVETMQIDQDDKVIKAAFVDDKMTGLSINGQKIAEADWDKYSGDIAKIREQIKLNKEQAKRNEAQAKLNELQAKKNEEQARLNELQVKENEIQAQKNQEQVRVNQLQAGKDQEQAERNQEQARRNQLQEKRNEEQAVKNQAQAKRNEIQAQKNQVQAEENERFIKQLTEDLVSDKIIPDAKSLRDFTMNTYEMTVNGVKQPDAVFKKYREKFDKASKHDMSYSRDGVIFSNQ